MARDFPGFFWWLFHKVLDNDWFNDIITIIIAIKGNRSVEDITRSYLSSSEVAKMLNIHPFSVQKLIRGGKLEAEKVSNRWLVRRSVLDEFAKTYVPKRGRPIGWRKKED